MVVACRQAGREAASGGGGTGAKVINLQQQGALGLPASSLLPPSCLPPAALPPPTLRPRSRVSVPATHPHRHLCGLGAGLSAVYALAQRAAGGNGRGNALQTGKRGVARRKAPWLVC